MSGIGRGRGETSKTTELERQERDLLRRAARTDNPDRDRSSPSNSSSGGDSGEKAVRGRAGYRGELRTIPSNITQVHSTFPEKVPYQKFNVMSNFVVLDIKKVDQYHQYRITIEPHIESVELRRKVFSSIFREPLGPGYVFDGNNDAHSSCKIEDETKSITIEDREFKCSIKHVAVSSSAPMEILRIYNIGTKRILRALEFFQISSNGAYIHPQFTQDIGQRSEMVMVRGFRTTVNVHERDAILVNLEPVNKIMQRQNVLKIMSQIRDQARGNLDAIRAALVGKLVVTNYKKNVYRVEDVDFKKNPMSTFFDDRKSKDVTFIEYFQDTHHQVIKEKAQPLLLVTQNNRRKGEETGKDLYLVPELCNIAGLTEEQRNDNRLKMDLIRASQVDPDVRVRHMMSFLEKIHNTPSAQELCRSLGFNYAREPIKFEGKVLPLLGVGLGEMAKREPQFWPKVGHDGGFENLLKQANVADVPVIEHIAVIITRLDLQNENEILSKLGDGFKRIGLRTGRPDVRRITDGDSANVYVQALRSLPSHFQAVVVIMHQQNKERYDAIKKYASVERGLITQVVTARLMMDARKASGAAIKIGLQIATKVGGSPWYIQIPLQDSMICGYDTYHDTANRGRSFGAFVASMNKTFSRWFSKADSHDQLSELSSHMAENMSHSIRKFQELNGRMPGRVFIYRDGVSEGQIRHVWETELKEIKRALTDIGADIKLTFIIVNKRVGARFFQNTGGKWINCASGMVIDDHVTRKHRYDFYLVSQHTRQGTVTPTYYNIIHDESGLTAFNHQAMAHRLTHLYYNWSGPVRVPAPCQYAHKMALLCGEHLHATPNHVLDDRLHYL